MKKSTLCFMLFILASCSKNTGEIKPNEDIKGNWILKDSNGIGAASKLEFLDIGGTSTLRFDLSGSIGANGLKMAETPYKMENNKLSFIDYESPKNGYYNVTSFEWIVPGKEFMVKFHQILLSVSSDRKVIYSKVE